MPMQLLADIDDAAFDALHDDPAAWRGVMESLAREHGVRDAAAVRQETAGSVLVARLGRERVLKLYPPFMRDHCEFECATLERLHGRLSVPTPRLVGRGERDGWPYIVMTQLAGEPLTATWPTLAQDQRLELLATLGALTAEVHALPSDLIAPVAALAPRWDDFIAQQRRQCLARQQRRGLPPHLLAALPAFVAEPVPRVPPARPVLLTGEYTPMNLFTREGRLAAMFDFGDGLVGPREYDWLGPLCFLAAGDAARCAAFMGGVGVRLDDALRLVLLRLLLLHRYSNPPAQIGCQGWQQAGSLEELARRIWP